MVQRAISNIRNALVAQQTEIMSVAAMLMGISIITKVFGLIYNAIAAGYLGLKPYSLFTFASNIPELITQIVLLGSISASVLPILSTILQKKGKERFLRVFNTLVNISLISYLFVTIFIIIFAPFIVNGLIAIIKPQTPLSASDISEITNMLRLLTVPQVILGISVYLTTVLNLFERFLAPQLAPLFYNVGRITAVFLLIPILGKSPWVLVWGTLIGSVCHLFIQLIVVGHIGVFYKPIIDIRDRFVRKVGVTALPRILSLSVDQIANTIDEFIAFGLIGNSLAIYNLGVTLISVPLSVIGSSFATASFPTLAKAFVNNDRIVASQIFIKIINQILFFSIISSILLLVLRVPYARLAVGIFGKEIKFQETYTIAWVVLFFAPGIAFESLRGLLYRTFFAAHDTIRPLFSSVIVLIAGGITGLLFTNYLSHFNQLSLSSIYFDFSFFFTRAKGIDGVGGLALSSTLVFTIEAILLIYWLNRKYLQATAAEYFLPITKKLLAGTITLICTYLIYKIWASLEMTEHTVYLIILTFTTSASALMIYLGFCGLFRVDEVKVYLKFLSKHPNKGSLMSLLKRYKAFNPIPEKI